jgi:nicotinamidase-related amidase
MVWPYHAMLGGIGHALVSAVEEACFFHNLARSSQTRFEQKGSHPLTENYSALSPEVPLAGNGWPEAKKNTALIERLLAFDVLIVAGQAKSHCVAWTVEDLLAEIQARDPALASKVYLLEDCTSPVVAPGADFTAQADAAFHRFAAAGMRIVQSSATLDEWPV